MQREYSLHLVGQALQVAELLDKGLTNNRIGEALGVSGPRIAQIRAMLPELAPYQKEEQDRGIAALGATDTGISWTVTESGKTVHDSPEFRDMLARAGRDFDVLIVAYVSRLGRNAAEGLRATETIKATGAAVYFADDRILTSDERQWEQLAREMVEAEAYRRRLSRTMKQTYESRWRRRGLPAGVPPYGFNPDWSHHPEQAEKVRAIFSEYATGTISLRDLAIRHDLAEEHVKVIVRNPAYTGLAQRNGATIEGSFEAIVGRALFDRVTALRTTRRFAGGGTPKRPLILNKRQYCACGTKLWFDGQDRASRLRHRDNLPCPTWGKDERKPATLTTDTVKSLLRSLRPTDTFLSQILRGINPQPQPLQAMDTRPTKEALARQFSRGHLSLTDFTTKIAALEAQAALAPPETPTRPPITLNDLREFYGAFRDLDATTDEASWATYAAQVFERVEYQGPNNIGIALTQSAKRNFVPAALPQRVGVGGEGLEPPTSSV